MSGFGVPKKTSKRSLSQISKAKDAPAKKVAVAKRASLSNAIPMKRHHASNSDDSSSDVDQAVLPDDVSDTIVKVDDTNDMPSSSPFARIQRGSEPTSPVYGKKENAEDSDGQDADVAPSTPDDDEAKSDVHDADPPEDEDDNDTEDEENPLGGINAAWSVMRGLCTHLSHGEVAAINRGQVLHGPPGANPVTQANALKTIFRWPVRARNLLRTSFEMEPSRIDLDLDEVDNADDADTAVDVEDSGLPALPEPICAAVAKEYRRHRNPETQQIDDPSELQSKLAHLVRGSAVFVDSFMELLLVRNAAALQGNEQHYSNSAWSSIQGVPCANWKFVAESLDNPPGPPHRAPTSLPAIIARLTPETKARIMARLEAIYDESWAYPKE
ncbi:hypothetical protein H310_11149 [Aphanomyces invadans]|uniref:Uncharacterized protein n=1 Tax=Aphanomyces invadans TaxID=157072 RepID=A0A024TPF2_9STRA|nr:hypothetical protein H310_11149 [Aphanomyces invadans]ETV95242.1 hypothetical protein H310_11149 [Aphanomyces invadans]|eukprot:XP_008875943.1 hypothetical protein H310_11149 [Aphanomyces invadans]